jgi:glycosyltransferase involved in cell wall biosynthesis
MLCHNVAWRSTFFRCFYFARQLRARGHRVTIVATRPAGRRGVHEEVLDGVELTLTPDLLWGMGRSGWDPWNTWNRMGYLRRQDYDLVHAFDSRPAVIHPALAYRRHRRVPLVMDWADWWGRGGVTAERKNPLLRHGFTALETFYEEHFRGRADHTTTISAALARRAAALGIPKRQITQIRGGADLDRFKPQGLAQARASLGLPAEVPLLTFAGFVHYDLDLVLNSFLIVRRAVPTARLMLCGPDSQITRTWKHEHPEAAPALIESGVVPINLMPTHLAASDILLLPLRDSIANRGRWPNKLGEYLAMGRPVVANPTGEVGELLQRTGAGVLAGAEPEAFGSAVAEMLMDPERRAELGGRARQVAEDELDYAKLAGRLLAVYEAL